MANKDRNIVALQCEKCGNKNYTTYKSKLIQDKLAMKKYCPTDKEHTAHKEVKVK